MAARKPCKNRGAFSNIYFFDQAQLLRKGEDEADGGMKGGRSKPERVRDEVAGLKGHRERRAKRVNDGRNMYKRRRRDGVRGE